MSGVNGNYRIRSGDTLSKIAERYHTTVDVLAKANNIKDPNKILAGQTIRIPDGFEEKSTRVPSGGPRNDTGTDSFSSGRPTVSTSPTTEVNPKDIAPVMPSGTMPERHVEVPYYSQFEGGHGFAPGGTACLKAASAMAAASGAQVLGPGKRIQVGISENGTGQLTVDPKAAAEGRKYIDQQLDAGKPVVVGVSHKDANYNVDELTDHFVTITGRGVDEKGRTYYTFHDPGTKNASKGRDTNPNNRFYVDDKTGMMYRPGKEANGYVTDRRFEVAMVRRNG